MIHAYGMSIQGFDHINKKIVCQDAYEIARAPGDVIIAAVADGVGSQAHSDMASDVAAKASVAHCKNNIAEKMSDSEILSSIEKAFLAAKTDVSETATRLGFELGQCGTTLTLAVIKKTSSTISMLTFTVIK